jgi:hypothetical protein
MSFSAWDGYTPCEWGKSQTCENKFARCEFCNQTHERQGLRIFADNRIRNYYEINPVRLARFKKLARV